jgi:hypothetical protein
VIVRVGFALALAVGCATRQAAPPPPLPVEILTGSEGKPSALITCGGGMRDCLRLASQLCPNGYSVQAQEHRTTGSKSSAVAITQGVAVGRTETRDETSMMVSCPGVREQLAAIERDRARKVEVDNRPKRCGYTCAPQPRVCPWLDDDGCYKPEYEVPPQ